MLLALRRARAGGATLAELQAQLKQLRKRMAEKQRERHRKKKGDKTKKAQDKAKAKAAAKAKKVAAKKALAAAKKQKAKDKKALAAAKKAQKKRDGEAAKARKAGLTAAEKQQRAAEKLRKQQEKEAKEERLMKYETRPPKRKKAPRSVVRPNPPLLINEWRGPNREIGTTSKGRSVQYPLIQTAGADFVVWRGQRQNAIGHRGAAEQYGGAVVIVPATLRDKLEKRAQEMERQGRLRGPCHTTSFTITQSI